MDVECVLMISLSPSLRVSVPIALKAIHHQRAEMWGRPRAVPALILGLLVVGSQALMSLVFHPLLFLLFSISLSLSLPLVSFRSP